VVVEDEWHDNLTCLTYRTGIYFLIMSTTHCLVVHIVTGLGLSLATILPVYY